MIQGAKINSKPCVYIPFIQLFLEWSIEFVSKFATKQKISLSLNTTYYSSGMLGWPGCIQNKLLSTTICMRCIGPMRPRRKGVTRPDRPRGRARACPAGKIGWPWPPVESPSREELASACVQAAELYFTLVFSSARPLHRPQPIMAWCSAHVDIKNKWRS